MLKKTWANWLAFMIILGLTLSACATPQVTPDSPTQPSTAAPTDKPVEMATGEPAPQSAETSILVEDARGKTITLAGPAQRIVSIVPSHTEILFAVGAGEQVVGRDMFSDYPIEALEVTDLGGGFGELDMETLISLQPDLVLAGDITAPEQVANLENLGLTVFVLGNPLTLEEMYTMLATAGELTGHISEVEGLVSSLQERVAAVDEKIATTTDRPLVFYELDGGDPNSPWTAGAGTFIDGLIARAGGKNLGSVLDQAWAQISLEELVAQDPDFIVLGDYTWGGVTPEDVAARAGWESLTAVQEGRVVPFDDNLVSRPGPRMVDGLEAMAALLHPELFP